MFTRNREESRGKTFFCDLEAMSSCFPQATTIRYKPNHNRSLQWELFVKCKTAVMIWSHKSHALVCECFIVAGDKDQ